MNTERADNYREAESWSAEFSRPRKVTYNAEDKDKLKFVPGYSRSVIDAFCEAGKSRNLDPPEEFFYSALRNFIKVVHPTLIATLKKTQINTLVALLDEREDNISNENNPRLWNHTKMSYLKHPPPGDVGISTALSLSGLYSKLSEKVPSW
jgi:hypothetical protein